MSDARELLFNVSAVAIRNRALILEGPPGSGKSSLALALIDRGAQLIGDDGVRLERVGTQIVAHPPPHTAGMLEIRGVGLVEIAPAAPTALALILSLANDCERLPETANTRTHLGIDIPALPFVPGAMAAAPRAEWALTKFGLAAT